MVEPSLDVKKYKKFNDNKGNVYFTSSSTATVSLVRHEGPQPMNRLPTLFETEESDEESDVGPPKIV